MNAARILIVEDNASYAAELCESLGGFGCGITVARSAERSYGIH